MQRHRLTRYLAITALIWSAQPAVAGAQAFGIPEIGTCAVSRGFGVTGSPCKDASAIFWNPAATTQLKGLSLYGGLAAIMIDAKFEQDTTFREYKGESPTALVPHLFASYMPANGKLSYGIGVYAPYGLTSQWGDDFPGRFVAKKAALAAVYVQPNVAYQLNERWSVGAGPVVGHSSIELIQALDLSEQVANPGPPVVRFNQLGIATRTEFGRAMLEGSSTAFGAHFGVFGKPNERWTVGLRFLTPLEFEYEDGEATFTQTTTGLVLPPGNPICFPAGTHPACGGNPNATVNVDQLLAPQFATGGALVPQGVKTRITHPAQIQAGFGYMGFANWLLSVDYAWTGWRRFRELPVTFTGAAATSSRVLIEDYNNTSAIRAGAQRSFANGANLRFGFSGVASAAPDETVTPLLPEQDRSYYAIGGEYPLTSRFAIEGAYMRVMGVGKRGRIAERNSRTQSASQLNTGTYNLSANVLSVSLRANY